VAARRITSYLFALLLAAGFDERGAVTALMSLHTYLAGTLSIQARVERPRRRPRALRRRDLAPEDRVLERNLMQIKPREWMEAGVETMLAGLRARLPARRAVRVDLVKSVSEG